MATLPSRLVRRTLLGVVGGFAAAGVVPTAVFGHADHASHADQTGIAMLPVAVFASGLLVLGAGLYLDGRDDVEDIYAHAGVFLGVGGLLAAIALFLF